MELLRASHKDKGMRRDLIENRQIRIFISSTFKDMQQERDYLVNRVFPELRRYCSERDVELTELDLRWGVTEEESQQGKVVEICLKEIDNTHPFFIGLIGERYGWSPDEKERKAMAEKTNVFEIYPWLNKVLAEDKLSITEVEMQYAVLQSEEEMNAYFYFRSSQMETAEDFREKPDSPAAKKLQRLKNELRSQTKYPIYDYASIENLGKQVERDFKALVDKIFPNGSLSILEKERLQQKIILRNLTKVYISNEKNMKRLDDFVLGNKDALVVAGNSGLGKSALIANWIEKQSKLFDGHLLYHFIGNSLSEGDYRKIAFRLINEIKSIYGLEEAKDELQSSDNQSSKDKDKQKKELEKLFIQIASKGKLLLVLDGVNQLADIDNAKLLNWLPDLPPNVKIIYSTLPNDKTMDVFKRCEHTVFILEPLSVTEQVQLINDYLKLFGKSLLPEQVQRIARDDKMKNALALRTLLDELRVFGIHEKIDGHINHYLSAPDLETFFDLVLGRLERAYNYDKTNFVSDVFSLIAVSRSGLTETELLTITNVAPLYWSQLYNVIMPHFTIQNGLITFSHQFLREAVRKRYLSHKEKENEYRKLTVHYLQTSANVVLNRKYDELPHQLYELHEWEKLYDFLCDLDVFDFLYNKDEYELGKYWRILIETNNVKYSLRKYSDLIDISTKDTNTLVAYYYHTGMFANLIFADFLLSNMFYQKALNILNENRTEMPFSIGNMNKRKIDYERTISNAAQISRKYVEGNYFFKVNIYNVLGNNYRETNDYTQALFYYQKALEIEEFWDELHISKNTAILYNNIGLIYFDMDDFQQSLSYYQKSLDRKEASDKNNVLDLAISYNNIGSVYCAMKNNSEALSYHQKALKIRQEMLGEKHPVTITSYFGIAQVYENTGDYQQALSLYQNVLKVDEEILGKNHLSTASSYYNTGEIYKKTGEYKQALVKHLQALEIRKNTLGEKHILTLRSYGSVGQIFSHLRDYRKAISYLKRALEIREDMLGENHRETGLSCYNISVVYSYAEDYQQALIYAQRALNIRLKLFGENHPNTIGAQENLDRILVSLKDEKSRAKKYFNDKGNDYVKAGNYREALSCYRKKLAILEDIEPENRTEIAASYYNIAFVYRKMHKYIDMFSCIQKYVKIIY
ncbi:MAG: tetratricopeptide repeat protein [Bacteroidales bacterium]|jgi:tetratricopeptide (TPR) repeat protein|nr:tetratricopeptide repeat protein [Bacteroidales bacterium]